MHSKKQKQVLIFICTPSGASYHILGKKKKKRKKKSLSHHLLDGNNSEAINLQIRFTHLIRFTDVRVCNSTADGYQGNEAESKLVVVVFEKSLISHKIDSTFP